MNKFFGTGKDKKNKNKSSVLRANTNLNNSELPVSQEQSDINPPSAPKNENIIVGTEEQRAYPFNPGLIKVTVIEGKNILNAQETICLLQHTHIGLTTRASQGINPVWDYSVYFDLSSANSEITIMIVEKGNTDLVHGTVCILPLWIPDNLFDLWLPLRNMENQPSGGMIHINLEFKLGKKKLTPNDFVFMTVLGEGSFGKVMQVRKKDNQQLYAMKVLKKQHLIEREEVLHTLAERKVLELNRESKFLVGLKYSFQTDTKLYLLLDYVPGGEVFNHLQVEQCFSVERSLFYTAQLILALGFLHEHGILYRDLKPENVLVDFTGYIALTDFGLCKMNMDHDSITETFCGTPEYMAPEVIKQKGYGLDIDWWSIGILLYEMLTGLPPFYDENVHNMYSKILFQPLQFDTSKVKLPAQDLIAKLLEKDPRKRLGHGKNGIELIKRQPFFKKIDWNALLNKRLPAPWKPELKSPEDVVYFDDEFTTRPAIDSLVDENYLNKDQQAAFNGFTYNESMI